jgi:hypothetical protein
MTDLQLNHLCTYKLITEDDEEEVGLREMLYKIQLLQTFNMEEFEEEKINNKIDKLYEIIKDEEFIKNIFEKHPYKGTIYNDLIFRTLFSYDYLDLFHKCLYHFFNNLPLETPLQYLLDSFESK